MHIVQHVIERRRVMLRCHQLDDQTADVGDERADKGCALCKQHDACKELDAVVEENVGAAVLAELRLQCLGMLHPQLRVFGDRWQHLGHWRVGRGHTSARGEEARHALAPARRKAKQASRTVTHRGWMVREVEAPHVVRHVEDAFSANVGSNPPRPRDKARSRDPPSMIMHVLRVEAVLVAAANVQRQLPMTHLAAATAAAVRRKPQCRSILLDGQAQLRLRPHDPRKQGPHHEDLGAQPCQVAELVEPV